MSELARSMIPTQPGSQYTNEERYAVLTTFYVTGNLSKTADMHNMPVQTVNDWTKSEWGHEVIGTIRKEKGDEVDAYFTKFIDAAFEQAQDRVENGDYRLTKDKELVRVPMGGYQLFIAGSTVYDKQRLHRNQPTHISSQNADAQMKSLMDKLREIAQSYDEKQVKVVSTQEDSELIE